MVGAVPEELLRTQRAEGAPEQPHLGFLQSPLTPTRGGRTRVPRREQRGETELSQAGG